MSINQIDEDIQIINGRIYDLKQKAQEIVLKINQVIPMFLEEWANYEIKSNIESHPEVLIELGVEKVSQLKKDLKNTSKQFPELSKNRLSSITWIHQKEISQAELDGEILLAYQLTKNANEAIDEVLRGTIGQIGEILINYGMTKFGEEWKKKTGQVRYSYGIPDFGISTSAQLRDLRINYSKIIEDYVNAYRDLRKAEKEKSIAEAKNLWDHS